MLSQILDAQDRMYPENSFNQGLDDGYDDYEDEDEDDDDVDDEIDRNEYVEADRDGGEAIIGEIEANKKRKLV